MVFILLEQSGGRKVGELIDRRFSGSYRFLRLSSCKTSKKYSESGRREGYPLNKLKITGA
jgi:hypothetical protein